MMAFNPDYLCPNGCAAQDALAEQIEARKRDADEIERLRAALQEEARWQSVAASYRDERDTAVEVLDLVWNKWNTLDHDSHKIAAKVRAVLSDSATGENDG